MIHWLVQGFLFGALIISISLSSSSCSSSTPTPAASPTAKNTSAIIQPPVTATTSSATLTASPTLGSVYFVNPSGNDSNTGRSESSAFRTIQRASNVSIAGDTILVMNGTYTNDCADCYVVGITRSGTATNWITYKAYPGHNPVLKFNGWAGFKVMHGASYIEISGFEIIGNAANITLDYALSQKNNGSNPLTTGAGIAIDGRSGGHPHHIRILKNRVHDCGGGGIGAIQSDYITFSNNEVYNNAWYSPYAESGIGTLQSWNYDDSPGYRIVITGNKVYNNRSYVPWLNTGEMSDGNGIIIDDGKNTQNGSTLGAYKGRTLVANNISFGNGGSGIHSYLSERVDIINNTAYMNNQTPGLNYGEIFANASGDVTIMNNILVASPNKAANSNWNNTGLTYDYNVIFGGSTIAVKGPHDLVLDPQFIAPSLNPLSANFRLTSSSPAINNGVDWAGIGVDFEGNVRPTSGAYDRGAYEYQPQKISLWPRPQLFLRQL